MNAILLAGAALVGLPIVLHLIMKQEPKRLPFPALRFLQARLKTNQRKLRLRHFILLAMRMLLIALFCLTLYQPTLFSEELNIRGEQPLAVAVVIDTRPSMGYVVSDRSRLEEACRRARELLDELPEGSRVAVLDTTDPGGNWSPSIADARRRIDGLKSAQGGGTITAAIATAYQMLRSPDPDAEGVDTMPKLVAVFTDRSSSCWDPTRVEDLKKLRDGLAEPKPIHAVIDLGVDQPANVAILTVEMKPQVVPADQPAEVVVSVAATGPGVEAVVRCRIDGLAGADRKPLTLASGQTGQVRFEFRDLKPGLHQIELGLEAADPLAFDNTRYYTFRVGEARKILTIADDPADALFWRGALSALGKYTCDVVRTADVKPETFGDYEVVCLLDVSAPSEALWAALQKYVAAGGKLIVIPGPDGRTVLADYTGKPALDLLPGTLKGVIDTRTMPAPKEPDGMDRRNGVTWSNLTARARDERANRHPLLAPFKAWRDKGNVDIITNPRKIWKFWDVGQSPEGAVIVTYDDADTEADRHPALLERTVGKGKVVLLTTRMDVPEEGQKWNDYWETTGSSWYVVFPDLLTTYLAGSSAEANFNYQTGQTFAIPLPRPVNGKRDVLTLAGPGVTGSDALIKPADTQTELRLSPPRTLVPGNFTLSQFGPEADAAIKWHEGFSLNVAPDESNLTKVPAEAIEAVTGPGTVFPIGKDLKLREVIEGKFTQPIDLFPWLLIAVLLLLAAEGLVANRFYRRRR